VNGYVLPKPLPLHALRPSEFVVDGKLVHEMRYRRRHRGYWLAVSQRGVTAAQYLADPAAHHLNP